MRAMIVSLMLVAVVLLCTQGVWAQSKRSPVKPRRLIFNTDGYGVFLNAEGDINKWIENIFAPLADSQVDALFWCDGTGGNTANYDSEVLELTGARIGKVNAHLVRWLEEGNDPPKVVVSEARKRGLDVFYSLRVNDIHDAFMPELFPTFKVEHPEWMIGEKAYSLQHQFPTSLDFTIPEVRQLKLRVIEEIFDKYDFDGLELDFMRAEMYFRPYHEYRYRFVLTDFLRTVRQSLDQRAEERGRRIELAARVDENLAACKLNGFDVATWIREGLIDILVMGSGPIEVDVPAFKELAQGTPVRIYPSMYGYPTYSGRYNPIPSGLARGMAANFWRQGADGIHLFNWYSHHPANAYQVTLMKELGDPQILATKDKIFAADVAYTNLPDGDYPHNWLFASLPIALCELQSSNSWALIPVEVADDLSGANAAKVRSVQLVVQVENLMEGNVVKCALNGQELDPIPQPDEDGCLKFPLTPAQLRVGRNEVGVRTERRSPEAATDIIVTAVEIHVDYP